MSWECRSCHAVNDEDGRDKCEICGTSRYGPYNAVVYCEYKLHVPDGPPFSHAASLLEKVIELDPFERLRSHEWKALAEWFYAEMTDRSGL